MAELIGESIDGRGILGISPNGDGVFGQSTRGRGLVGVTGEGTAIEGNSAVGIAVFGQSEGGRGVVGIARGAAGVEGNSASGDGVFGASETGRGVVGVARTASGVEGNSASGTGVTGVSVDGPGVAGFSTSGEGVHAETRSPSAAAVAALNENPAGTGAALFARKAGTAGHAGFFDGDVHVTRSVTVDGDVILRNADCAEEFSVADPALAEPGTVMVIGDGGVAVLCADPYDRRALGVVSGAGDFRPALLLDRQGGAARRPIALMGKVWCRVDADHSAIQPGDPLTTSSTPGHAMRASDPARSHGAVIGKALAGLDAGRGIIPILAMLQ